MAQRLPRENLIFYHKNDSSPAVNKMKILPKLFEKLASKLGKDNLVDINNNCHVVELFEATNNTSGTYFSL